MQASLQRTLLYSKPLAELLGQAKKSAGVDALALRADERRDKLR